MASGGILRRVGSHPTPSWLRLRWRCVWKQECVEKLLAHKVLRQLQAIGNGGGAEAFREVQTACFCARQQELSRKDVCLEFSPFMRAVILDTLKPDRRRLRRS